MISAAPSLPPRTNRQLSEKRHTAPVSSSVHVFSLTFIISCFASDVKSFFCFFRVLWIDGAPRRLGCGCSGAFFPRKSCFPSVLTARLPFAHCLLGRREVQTPFPCRNGIYSFRARILSRSFTDVKCQWLTLFKPLCPPPVSY